jgi:hypothetical protein
VTEPEEVVTRSVQDSAAIQFVELGRDLGELMGQEAIEQFGKLWSVVARGNQHIVEFNRNNALSKFRQITSGGNGEPERKSIVEPKNIISLAKKPRAWW